MHHAHVTLTVGLLINENDDGDDDDDDDGVTHCCRHGNGKSRDTSANKSVGTGG